MFESLIIYLMMAFLTCRLVSIILFKFEHGSNVQKELDRNVCVVFGLIWWITLPVLICIFVMVGLTKLFKYVFFIDYYINK